MSHPLPLRMTRARFARYCAVAALMAAVVMIAAIALPASIAHAGDLVVRYDQSQLLRLPRPVADVIIGNPTIADVTVQSGTMLVVTGKTFGVTNIIALDADRNVIQDQRVVVQRDDERTVNLMRGSTRQSYSCTPNCSPTVTVGDEQAFFDSASKQAATKTRYSESTAEQSGGGRDAQ